MVLRCKTLNFHIFEKMKIEKNIFEKIKKKLKIEKKFLKKVRLQLIIIETTVMILIFYHCFSSY